MLKQIAGKIWRKMSPRFRRRLVRLTQTEFTASVAAIVLNRRGEVLLLDHVLRPGSGWGIPGGFLKAGEQPEAALRREILEETGIELTNVELVSVGTVGYHVEIVFKARSDDAPAVKSREINAARWFAVGAMPESMNRGQRAAIEKFLRAPV